MPGHMVNLSSTILCPHAGKASIVTTNIRVKACGQPVALATDQFLITGCPFMIPPSKPSPCLQIQWLLTSLRVKVMGRPVVLKDSMGLCKSPEQIPQGPPNIVVTQFRVKGT